MRSHSSDLFLLSFALLGFSHYQPFYVSNSFFSSSPFLGIVSYLTLLSFLLSFMNNLGGALVNVNGDDGGDSPYQPFTKILTFLMTNLWKSMTLS